MTAEYSLRDDGGVRVINRGHSVRKGEWDQAEGKAYFVGDEDRAHLKVSFFGPFCGSYIVFGLDHENYGHSFVSGPNRDYLWLLAREPEVDEWVEQQFMQRAGELGFDVEQLIWVEHDTRPLGTSG